MAKIYSQLEKAQLENTTSDAASMPPGFITYRTDLSVAKVSNGALMKMLIDEDSSQTLANKTLTSPQVNSPILATPEVTGEMLLNQITTPANPAAGKDKLYFKADDYLYTLNSAGVETRVQKDLAAGTNTTVQYASNTYTIGEEYTVEQKKNWLYNALFEVNTRRVAALGTTNMTANFQKDRFSGYQTAMSVSPSTSSSSGTVVAGYQNVQRLGATFNTTGSYDTAGNFQFSQSLEQADVRHLQGKQITFSFYKKVTVSAGAFNGGAALVYGSTNVSERNPATLYASQTFTTTVDADFVRVSVTLTVPVNANSLKFVMYVDILDNGNPSTIEWCGFMVNLGPTAAPLTTRFGGFREEMDACKRYFQHSITGDGYPTSSATTWFTTKYVDSVPQNGYLFFTTIFERQMRATPTVTLSGGEGVGAAGSIYVGGTAYAALADRIHEKGFSRIMNNQATTWAGNALIIFNYRADAELT